MLFPLALLAGPFHCARITRACSEPYIVSLCDVQSVIPTIKLKSAQGQFEFYGRGDRNRTCDPLHPMQVLYQAELRPDNKRYTKPTLSKTQIFFIYTKTKTATGGFFDSFFIYINADINNAVANIILPALL